LRKQLNQASKGQNRRGQGGIALLMVLVIVAITTILTVGMISNQQQVLRRAGSLFDQDQARLYALGAEDFARELIRNDTQQDKQSSNPRDTLAEDWAQPLPPFPVPGGVIMARMTDAQSRFNLNLLVQNGTVNQPAVEFLKRLLTNLALPQTLVSPLIDWEDSDSNPVDSDGAEDDYYSRMTPPYRAANGPLVSISELYLIRGFTPDYVKALSPYVTALPGNTPMNVNTMGPVLIGALVDGLSPTAGDEMLHNRPVDGYKTVDDFLGGPSFNAISAVQRSDLHNLLDVRTNFFEMTADAVIDDRHCVLVSVLERGNSDTIAVVTRNFGHRFEPLTNPNPTAASSDLALSTIASGM